MRRHIGALGRARAWRRSWGRGCGNDRAAFGRDAGSDGRQVFPSASPEGASRSRCSHSSRCRKRRSGQVSRAGEAERLRRRWAGRRRCGEKAATRRRRGRSRRWCPPREDGGERAAVFGRFEEQSSSATRRRFHVEMESLDSPPSRRRTERQSAHGLWLDHAAGFGTRRVGEALADAEDRRSRRCGDAAATTSRGSCGKDLQIRAVETCCRRRSPRAAVPRRARACGVDLRREHGPAGHRRELGDAGVDASARCAVPKRRYEDVAEGRHPLRRADRFLALVSRSYRAAPVRGTTSPPRPTPQSPHPALPQFARRASGDSVSSGGARLTGRPRRGDQTARRRQRTHAGQRCADPWSS